MPRFPVCLMLLATLATCAEKDPEGLGTSEGPATPMGQPVDSSVSSSGVDASATGGPGGALQDASSVPPHDASIVSAHDASLVEGMEASTGEADAGGVDASASPEAGQAKPRLAISADFLSQTLSIFDIDKLREGATRSEVLVGSVDLSQYTPGPLALGVTPDGKTALVSISAGFLGAFIDVPPGDGTLLFVDLEKREVVGELFTGKSPMGIAISPDGKRAFVGQYAESYFSVVDIERRTFQKVPTGSQYNEELAIDDTGSVGILTYGPAGDAKTFSVSDPAGMLGQTTGLSGDAAGVAFFPGTKIAYLLQAPTVLTLNVGGHNLVDVQDPSRPVASDNVRVNDAPTMYPCTAVGSRKSVVFPQTKDSKLSLVEMGLQGGKAQEVQTIAVGAAENLAYGVASTPDARVLLAVPGEHYVGVVDLASHKAFTVPWEVTKSGPMDIKLIP